MKPRTLQNCRGACRFRSHPFLQLVAIPFVVGSAHEMSDLFVWDFSISSPNTLAHSMVLTSELAAPKPLLLGQQLPKLVPGAHKAGAGLGRELLPADCGIWRTLGTRP